MIYADISELSLGFVLYYLYSDVSQNPSDDSHRIVSKLPILFIGKVGKLSIARRATVNLL